MALATTALDKLDFFAMTFSFFQCRWAMGRELSPEKAVV